MRESVLLLWSGPAPTASFQMLVYNLISASWYAIHQHPLDDFQLVSSGFVEQLELDGAEKGEWIARMECSQYQRHLQIGGILQTSGIIARLKP